ncbi:cobalt ABC transporter permease [candidate division MSBL1 archaeon SCGC-AAA259J03]|uniref:Cobalt ABC transporter permease n=1 Tax=candidate division MSBL1 archaeon SCGC-AAA259J03 TaxID=1698269 RepID=A0A656YV76_9EURY|nr:cobalt ABC transporter permease [candidate division MSBL1 archaeon SCGC-AAA259J03]
MKHPEVDKYSSLRSPIHKLDPRLKLVSFLVLIFSMVLINDLRFALLGLFISFLLLSVSRLPLDFVFRHVKWVFLFVSPFLIIMPLTVGGSEMFQVFGAEITHEGVQLGLLVSIRALSAVILVFPMIGTMRFDTTIKALYDLKVPSSLVQMLMFTYRYIFTFSDEFSRMRNAMASKGFELKTNLETLNIIGKAIGMLFVRAYERAERVYQAMLSRGYTGNPKTLTAFRMKRSDYLLATLIIGFAILLHAPALVI